MIREEEEQGIHYMISLCNSLENVHRESRERVTLS